MTSRSSRPASCSPKGRSGMPRTSICCSATCRATTCAAGRARRRRRDVPQALRAVERPRLGPPGPAARLRARDQPRHPHRGRRQHHRARQPLRGQGAEQPERHRGEAGRRRSTSPIRPTAASEYYGVPRPLQLDFRGVYRVEPPTASSTLLADDFGQPNGLCFSRDERRLFVNDTERQHIRVFDVRPDGTLANGRVWAETTGEGAGAPDGMKIDSAGNVYCCGPGGIHVFAPDAHLPRRDPHAGIHRQLLLRRRRPAEPLHHRLDFGLSASRDDAGHGPMALCSG